jgi:hypothetical protein
MADKIMRLENLSIPEDFDFDNRLILEPYVKTELK